jgi:hypothetical protein
VNEDVEQVQETLRQLNLIYSGLIVIGVYLVQPFLVAGSLDLSATVCVIAFSVAIPLLAALVVINRQEAFRRRMTKSTPGHHRAGGRAVVRLRRGGRRLLAHHVGRRRGDAGGRAGGGGVHSAGYARLEGYRWRRAEDGGERRDAGS